MIVKKVHFSLLVFLLMNFTLGLVSDTKFSAKLVFAIKVITYLSGIFLFFFSLKHRKLVTIYYSLYILSPVAVVLSWLSIPRKIEPPPLFSVEPEVTEGK